MIVQELAATLGLEIDEAVFSRAEQVLKGVEHGLLGLGAVVAGVALGLGEVIHKTTEHADAIDKASQQIGVSRTALQELQYAAAQSSVGNEELNTSLQHLARSAYEASRGSEEQAAAFQKLGVHVKGADGKLRPVDELLSDVADKFASMPDGVDKTALAMQTLGRSGAGLNKFLNTGAAGIAEMRARAHDLGVVLSDETIAEGVELGDSLDDLSYALKGVTLAIGGPLLKEVTAIVKRMTEWVRENRKLIAQPIVKFVHALGDAAKWAAENVGKLKIALGILASFMLGKVLFALSATMAATLAWAGVVAGAALYAVYEFIAAQVALLASLAPWALLAAAIILVGDELYTFATGGETLLGRFISYLDSIDPTDSPLIELFKSAGSLLFDFTDPAKWTRFGKAIESALSDPLDWIEGKAFELENYFREMVKPLVELAQWLDKKLGSAQGTVNAIGQGIGDFARDATSGISSGGKWLGDTIGGLLGQTPTSPDALTPAITGGAASPAASANVSNTSNAKTVNYSPNVAPNFTVNVPPGVDPHAVGNATADAFSDWWGKQMADDFAAVNGG